MAKKDVKTDSFDNIGDALTTSEAFFEKYRNIIFYVVGGIILAVLLVMAVRNYIVKPKEIEAADKMVVCENYFARDSFNLALNGDGVNDGFAYVVDNYKITKSAKLAAVYAGACCYHLGKYDEAINYLKKFKADSKSITPAAIGLIGDCYIELGDAKSAVSYFKKAVEASKENILTAPVYLQKAGLAYESLGEYGKAVDAYTEIKDKYYKSAAAAQIDKYIDRATYLLENNKK